MKVAYVTADSCGSGHAVRGIALVQAAERLQDLGRFSPKAKLRAFGPPVRPHGPLPDLAGYEASTDWRQRVLDWQPDLLLGDLRPGPLDALRTQLGVPAWLLLRIWTREWRGAPGWERVVSIEPGAADLGVTHSIPPIVGPWRFTPPEGAELPASYNVFWESHLYGFPVRWVPGGSPDCALRLRLGTEGVSGNGADVLVRQVNGGY